MRIVKLLTVPVAILCAMPLLADDPVLMEVGSDKVTLSEFEYLYHKNSQQQLEKESLDDYLERFAVYKLKVEDAKAAGIDTTSAFKKEFGSYRKELAAPYLQDSTVIERLAEEAYDRMKSEVEVEHIMLPLVPEYEMPQTVARLDSIKQCILNGEDFGDLAVKYSIDRSAKVNRGLLGYLTVGRVPYSFEKAAFDTPVGEMAIVRTDFGVHLIKVLDKRPSQGEVLVEHILKLFPRNANDSAKAAVSVVMDSIYAVVKGGADFEKVATNESEDPGSAAQGGKLPWFGTGRMVPEFEQVSFALAKDSISRPFATRYGIHIVKKLDSRGLPAFAQCKAGIMRMMQRDERANMPREAKVEELKKEFALKENSQFIDMVGNELEAYGKYDSTLVDNLQEHIDCVAFSFAGKDVMANEVFKNLDRGLAIEKEAAMGYITNVLHRVETGKVIEHETELLGEKYPDYRNLLNEYFDGMMLFEISNRKVWDKANKDVEGLEKFFESHRSDYTWNEPRFKGYVIYTANDSLKNAIEDMIKVTGRDSLFQTLRKHFKRNVRIEYLLVKKGENPEVDNLAFGVDSTSVDGRLPISFEFESKIIDQPEEMADVRGQVTADYQSELEKQWVANLKDKYKVKIHKKVLKKVKPL